MKHTCTILEVNFKEKKITKRKTVSCTKRTPKSKKSSLKGFSPPQGNFKSFSKEELQANSDLLIKHIHELSLDDIYHFIHMGSLDKIKVAKVLKLKIS